MKCNLLTAISAFNNYSGGIRTSIPPGYRFWLFSFMMAFFAIGSQNVFAQCGTVNAVSSQAVCNGNSTAAITFTSSVAGTTYTWTNSNTAIGLAASGSGNISSFTTTNVGNTASAGTITVTPFANGCSGSSVTFTITVNPTPVLSGIGSQALCNGTASAAVNFSSTVAGTTFTWTNSNASIGLGASGSGSTIAAFTTTNSGSSPIVGTVNVTPTAGTCAGVPHSFTITVNPTPAVTTPSNQTACNNTATAAVNFTGTVSGETFSWTNSNAAIGLGLSGSGNIASFSATNEGTSAIFASITVTPSANLCNGPSQVFTVTVNPTPVVSTTTPGNQSVCNGSAMTAETFTGAVAGTTFTWSNNNSSIGLAASGTGNVPSFTATNTGATIATSTITVTPGAAGCTGPTQTFTETVNPTPTVNSITSQALCTGVSSAAINFSGAVAGTMFNWTNSGSTTTGLGASGSGNIGSFLTTNGGVAILNSNVTVTPTANSCTGAAQTFTITVNPIPTITSGLPAPIVCNEATAAAINFTGAVTGTAFNWTNSNNTIGIGSSGSGSIAAFTALNSSTTGGISTANIVVTPVANGCSGTTGSFTITVNPTPYMSGGASNIGPICPGVSYSDPVNFASLTGGATFNWTNSNTTIGLGASGALATTLPTFTPTNTSPVQIFGTIIVTPSANGCTGIPSGFTITVNPLPGVTGVGGGAVPNQTVCNGVNTVATVFVPTITGETFVWSNSNNIGSIGVGPTSGNVPVFTAVNASTVQVTSVFSVTPTLTVGGVGCSAINPTIFTYFVNPTPNVTTSGNQAVCNGTPTAIETFTSVVTTPVTIFNWTNNNTTIGLANVGAGPIASFTGVNTTTGIQVATVTVTPIAAACLGAPAIVTYTVYPTPTMTAPASQAICNGSSTAAVNFTGPVAGTSFTWTNSNVTIGLPNSGAGNIASFTGMNSGTVAVTGTMVVTPSANGCNGPTKTFGITVNPTPTVVVPSNITPCNGDLVAVTPFSGSVTGTTYSWTNNMPTIGIGSSGTGNIPTFTAANTGTSAIPATIVVSPVAAGCPGTPQQFNIVVNPTPTVITPVSQTVCNGAATSTVFFASPVTGATFTWVNSTPAIGLSTTGAGNITSFTGLNTGTTPLAGTITVTPSANGCTGIPQNFTITVNPAPTVFTLANQLVCNGLSTANIAFSGLVSGSTFTWTNSNTSIGLGSSGSGNIASFIATNTGTTMQTSTVTVTPAAGGCNGTPQSFLMAVNPTPDVQPVANQVLCNGAATTAIAFTGSVSGTAFNWTNSDPTIGLAATGSGNIASFAAINHGATTLSALITVTPAAAGCTGIPQTFNFNIKPTPTVATPPNQVLCNGAISAPVAFSGVVSGTSFAWSNSNTSIGLGASGSGNITSFISANTTGGPQVGTITITPSALGCVGTTVGFNITVNPTPNVNSLANQTICNSSGTGAIAFSGAVSGTTFTWSNSLPGIGIAAAGTGNILPFTASNTGTTPIIDLLTVTPSAYGCTGISGHMNITVDPTPTVVASANQTVCNGAGTAAVTFTGAVTGATYNWTNSNPTIGLAASGAGNIAAFMAANGGNVAQTAMITVSPSALGCNGASNSFTITVNPTPVVNPLSGQSVCNGMATTAVAYSGAVTGTTFSWSNSLPSIGLAASGVGNIGPFMAVNHGTAPVTATVMVTPSAVGCIGLAQSFAITVNPTPNIYVPVGQTVCNNATTATASLSGAVSGSVYNWTNSNATIGLATSGCGDITPFTATNTGTSAISGLITVMPTANGCNGTPGSFTITVNPTPTVATPADQALCNNAMTTPVAFTGIVSGTSFAWTNAAPAIGLAASGAGTIPAFTALNSGATALAANITVTPTAHGCAGFPASFMINVNPTPTVASTPNQAVCNTVSTTAVNFTGAVSGTSFNWTNDLPGIGLAASGSGNISAFTGTNGGSAPEAAVVTVLPSASGCIGAPSHFTITVNPTPNVALPADQSVCNGASTAFVLFSGSVSGTTFAWVNSNSGIGLGLSGSGNIGSFTTTNLSDTETAGIVTVAPSANGCSGASQSFNIFVYPTPNVTVPSDQSVCNGTSIPSETFTGNVTGTIFTWANSNITTGLPSSGTGNTPPFLAANTGVTTNRSTITVTPVASGCAGTPQSFVINVYPTPTLATPASQSLCNGVVTAAVAFSGPVSGTTYTWSNNNSTVGLASTGTGNIASFGVTNTGNTPQIAVVTVSPVANGCAGVSNSFEYIVNPTPDVSGTPSGQTVCNGLLSASINFTGSVAGTSYVWANDNPSIGLAAVGSGNIGAFSAIDVTSVPEIAVITVTPSASYCAGAAQSFTVTVNPTPDVQIPANQAVCSGSYTSPVYFTGSVSGTIYSWTNSNSGIGLPASGTGNIASFMGTNSTSLTSTGEITVKPTGAGCIGAPQNFNISINPNPVAPVIGTLPSASVCTNTQYQNFGAATAAPAGIGYSWSVSNATLCQVGAGGQYSLVSFPGSGTAVITLTNTIGATNCKNESTYGVTVGSNVSDQPVMTYSNNYFVCQNYTADSYVWGYDDAVTLDSSLISGQVNQEYYNANPDLAGKYYWVITTKGGCSQKTYYILPTTGVVNTAQTGTELKMFPNPADNVLNITLSGPAQNDIEARIFDMTGREVAKLPIIKNTAEVNVEQLASGTYSVICFKDGLRFSSASFIKQ